MQERLDKILEDLKRHNASSGAQERYDEYAYTIIAIGWNAAIEHYHPDNNPDDPARFAVYNFVKFVHGDLVKKGIDVSGIY